LLAIYSLRADSVSDMHKECHQVTRDVANLPNATKSPTVPKRNEPKRTGWGALCGPIRIANIPMHDFASALTLEEGLLLLSVVNFGGGPNRP
jgi:hypothetical protein